MADRCDAHDKCMAEAREEIGRLKDRNSDVCIKLATMEMRLVAMEKDIEAIRRSLGGWNWRGNIMRLFIGLIEKGIIIIVGMAYWAHINGFGG